MGLRRICIVWDNWEGEEEKEDEEDEEEDEGGGLVFVQSEWGLSTLLGEDLSQNVPRAQNKSIEQMRVGLTMQPMQQCVHILPQNEATQCVGTWEERQFSCISAFSFFILAWIFSRTLSAPRVDTEPFVVPAIPMIASCHHPTYPPADAPQRIKF